MWLILLTSAVAAVIYFKFIKPMRYWKQKGVPYEKPLPIFGNFADTFFLRRPSAYVIDDIYKAYPDSRYIGLYNFTIPALLVRDAELIKRITVKEFDAFPEHRSFIPDGIDPLWDKNLFTMKGGERWQDARSTLSPAFTSGKMRLMFELMRKCSKQFSTHFLKQGGTVSMDMKDAFARFANDVIATTAFGITCNSLDNEENEFYMMGKEATNLNGLKALTFSVSAISPTLMRMLNITVFSKKVSNFFRGLIRDTIKVREEKGVIRPDMIHLLMEARKGRLQYNEEGVDSGFAVVEESEVGKYRKRQKAEITDEEIAGLALGFFFAGFDGVSTMMCYAAYELAVNPDIQEKLQREVDEALNQTNGEITYDILLSMKYLDMVISETLRKWAPFIFRDRRAVRAFTIEPEKPGEKLLRLEPGTVCFIPAYSIQRDPAYFPNPDKFDPERFSEANRHKIKPFTYLPFGSGPRNCIGSRFALLEGKVVIAEIISKFEIVPVKETPIPVVLDRKSFHPMPEGGFWLGLTPTNKNT